ncbi:NRDE family protein [Aneurinibacillus tyrosinisolvens]|uniref:NRDE family protein n=1 Tax=Aneurinibacillus tyrosinisolvens TaxID=1443435 RepID=UPI00063F35B9|nr:NRDE family protein [Aneurinibacillus tyrosinisolvens]
MCLILFAYKAHPDYPLIVAANRDEFYNRPTAPAAFWEDYPFILAGRDLEKMGTWMGVTKTGRFAAITNYRDPLDVRDDVKSRGELVSDYLSSDIAPEQYLCKVKEHHRDYNRFNLLVGDTTSLFYYSTLENIVSEIEPGIHGLSNHVLDTSWPKVSIGKERLAHLLKEKGRLDTKPLFDILSDEKRAPDTDLPNTGVGIEWERMLSPLFIRSGGYGTRSSTVVLFNNKNRILFEERFYQPDSLVQEQSVYEFDATYA